MSRTPRTLSIERRLDNTYPDYPGHYFREPVYFVGTDESRNFREKIEEMYGDNPQITDAVAQLGDYFSDGSFEERPEVRNFAAWVRRSIVDPKMADEITGEIVNQGYITALKRLGYRDAPLNVAFSRNFAKQHGTCFVDAFMFGPGGAARIPLADWLVEEKLYGMYRSGKVPGSSFSEEAKEIWYEAEDKHRQH